MPVSFASQNNAVLRISQEVASESKLTVSDIPCQKHFFKDRVPLLLPTLECNGTILAHHKLHPLDSSDSPASASLVAGIIGMHHDTRLIVYF